MTKKLFPIAVALALASLPAIGSAKVHTTYAGNLTFTYSLVVNADCTLTQNPGGNFAFAAISALGTATGENTAENLLTTQCAATTAVLLIYDGANTGSTNYVLTSGAHTINFNIQNATGGTGTDYTNSNSTGITLNNTGTVQTWPLYGWLPPQGTNVSGSYSDTVTAAINFS